MRSLAPEPPRPRSAVHAGESPPKATRFPCRGSGSEPAKGAQVASDAGASRVGRRQERRKWSGRREADAVTPCAQVGTHTHTAGGQETERHGKVNRTPPAPWTGASADETINNSRGTRLVCAPPALSPFPIPPTSLPLARSGSPSLFTPTSPPLISSLFACPRKEPGGNGVSAAGLEPDRPRSSPEAAARAQELRIGAQDPRVRADVHVGDFFYLDILQSSSPRSGAVICNRRSIRGTV